MDEKPLDQQAIDDLLQTTGRPGRRARGGTRKGGGEPPDPPRPTARDEPADGDAEPLPDRSPRPAQTRSTSPREVYAHISQVPVEIAVVLGDLELPISEILNLKPGSVVQLDAWIDAPVEIRMRGRTVARAQIVTLEDSYALRIVENLIAAPDFPAG